MHDLAHLEAEVDRLSVELDRRDRVESHLRQELRHALSDAREASDALMLGCSGKAYSSLREVCRRLHEAGKGEA